MSCFGRTSEIARGLFFHNSDFVSAVAAKVTGTFPSSFICDSALIIFHFCPFGTIGVMEELLLHFIWFYLYLFLIFIMQKFEKLYDHLFTSYISVS